jgi:hypothetical protein
VSDWYYISKNERRGPVSETDLKDLLLSGELTSESMVWAKGMEAWSRVYAVDGMMPEEIVPPPIPATKTLTLEDTPPLPETPAHADSTVFDADLGVVHVEEVGKDEGITFDFDGAFVYYRYYKRKAFKKIDFKKTSAVTTKKIGVSDLRAVFFSAGADGEEVKFMFKDGSEFLLGLIDGENGPVALAMKRIFIKYVPVKKAPVRKFQSAAKYFGIGIGLGVLSLIYTVNTNRTLTVATIVAIGAIANGVRMLMKTDVQAKVLNENLEWVTPG